MTRKDLLSKLARLEEDLTSTFNKLEDRIYELRKITQDVEYLRGEVEDDDRDDDP